MSLYTCECCGYSTHIKTHYMKHLLTKKHETNSKTQKESKKESYQCRYCFKNFKFKQSMYKHIKYSCKKNTDEDLKELARLLNEHGTNYELSNKKVDYLKKKINKLTNKLQITNVIQGDVHHYQQNNNIYNINLLNHKDTDYSHLTAMDYISCIKMCNYCVKMLVQKVHFCQNKPENMNIYISNIKDKYAIVYNDNQWQITNKKEQIDDLFDTNENILESWYDKYKDEHPEIVKCFERYMKNREEDQVIDRVKDKILLMLYNNRTMVTGQQKLLQNGEE